MLIDQRRQNRTFSNVVGADGITGLQIRFANVLRADHRVVDIFLTLLSANP